MSILSDLVNEANKKKQQLTQMVSRDVVHPVEHAANNVSHAVSTAAQQTFAPAPNQAPAHNVMQRATNDFANVAHVATNLNPIAHFVVPRIEHIAPTIPKHIQSAINTHVPTPLRGVSSFANNTLIKPLATEVTHAAKISQGKNPYHGTNKQIAGQIGTDALNVASIIPAGRAAKGIATADKTLPTAVRAFKAAKMAAIPGAGYGAGFGLTQSLENNDNLKRTAINTGIGAIAGGTLGAATGAASPLVGAAARKAGKEVAASTPIQVAKNLGLKPPTKLSDEELNASRKVMAAHAGYSSPMDLTENDAAHFHNAQLKLGVKPGTPDGVMAVDKALAAHRVFDENVQQRVQAIREAKDKAVQFSQDHPLGMTSGAVDEHGNKLGLNGEPINSTSIVSTGHEQPQQLPHEAQALQTAQHPGEVLGSPLAQNKTGVVDKQLNDLHGIRKQLLDAETEKVLGDHNAKLPAENLYQKVLSHGGISTKSGDFAELPTSVRRNSGLGIDVVAKEMGYPDEHALYEDLLKYRDRPAPISKAQAKELAQKNLDTGNSEYTSDWQQLHQMIGKRQDELSQYPNGKYRQVKVTNKPPQMSDAEFQSLTQTPEGMQPKTTNKVIERNPKIALRNADAEREVQSILSKGGTTDEALNAYMKSTGTDLQTAVHDVKRVAQESNIGFNGGKNPLEGSVKLPIVQAGDHAQAFLNADFVKQHEQAVGKQALESFNSLSDHDKTLLQNIEKDTVPNVAKQADNPKSFTEAEKNIRTYYDTRHAYDKALGIDVGYRQNYLRQLFTKAEEEAKASLPDQVEVKNGNKNPGYTKARSFDTLHTHVGTALERDINGSSSNHARLAYAKGLEEAYPGKVNTSGQMVRGEEGNYHQLTNRYGDAILAEKSIANKINSRSYVDTENKLLQKYDKANAGLKYVKLGGGAFHAVTEAGNFIGQQLTSGKLFTNPTASGKVLKTFFSPKAMDKANAEFRANGTMDKAALSGLKIMAKDILADADVKLGGKLSKYSGIQALHDATFQREIPYAKLKIFEQKTKGLDVHNPADLAKMRSVADGVNNLFGGINRDIQGIRPKEFKVLQRLVLATDFTEGKVKTAFRAINITDRSPAANLARQAVLGKALLFTALATAGAAASGDYKGKSPKEIALDIGSKIGDPKFSVGDYSVSLPATHVSEFSRPVTPLFKSKGSSGAASTPADRLKGIQKYGTNRLAAIPSEALQLITNKDAGGNRIYGKDYKFNGGEQITPGKSGMNIASGFAPIPVSQAIGVGTGRVNVPAAIANVAGLRVSNDKLYNQDATPVTLNVSDNKVNLPKDQAIKFNAAVATQKTNLDAQLKASDSYKSASPDKQKAMLTTLHKDITGGQQRIFASSNNIPITKKATKAEQDIIDNKLPDISSTSKGKSNTTPISKNIDNTSKDILKQHDAMTTAQYNHLRDTQPDYEYKYLQAKYNNDKANGKLNSATKDIAAQKTLAKAAIGKDYSHEVRDLHNLSTSNLYTYLSTPEKGKDKQKIAADILAYDNALTDAGLQTKGKFHDKNGKVTLVAKNSSGSSTTKKTSSGRSKGSSTGRSTSGSRSGGKGKSLATLISEFKLPNDSLKYQSKGANIARSAGLAKKKSTVS